MFCLGAMDPGQIGVDSHIFKTAPQQKIGDSLGTCALREIDTGKDAAMSVHHSGRGTDEIALQDV